MPDLLTGSVLYAGDAWAVLELLEGSEPAASRVSDVLEQRPVMSWINLGEVVLTGDPELLVDGAPWQWEDLRT